MALTVVCMNKRTWKKKNCWLDLPECTTEQLAHSNEYDDKTWPWKDVFHISCDINIFKLDTKTQTLGCEGQYSCSTNEESSDQHVNHSLDPHTVEWDKLD